jgi:hypothetical protein
MAIDPLDFYKLLYDTDQDGNLPNNLYLALFAPPKKGSSALVLWHQNVAEAIEQAKDLDRDVHMQVALSDHIIPGGKRNDSQYVGEKCISAFPAFFADVDCYKLFPDYIPGSIPDELRKIVEIDDLKPTAYVNSGGGLHIWWMFGRLVPTNDPKRRRYVSELLTRFGMMLKSRAKGTSIEFDSVFDTARVLRIAGTYNYKKEEKRICEVIELDPDNTYYIEQFEDMCDAYTIELPSSLPLELQSNIPRDPSNKNQNKKIDIINETIDVRLITMTDEEEDILKDKIESLCDADDDFNRAYNCYGLVRTDPRIDVSKILQVLAFRSAAAAEYNLMFSDTEIYYIFKYFIKRFGINDEHYNDSKRITRIDTFVKPTINKARKLSAEIIAVNELKELSQKPKEHYTTGDLKKIYETIKRLHGFLLVSFTKVSDGSYEMMTEYGMVTIPNTESLGDQKKLQLRFMECIQTTFQPIKSESFRHTINMLFSIMETRLSDPERDLSQQVRSFLIDYILQSNDLDQNYEDTTNPEKSEKTGRWRIMIEVFVRWIKNVHGVVTTVPEMAKALLNIEAERHHGRFHGIRRHHWILPEDLTTEIDLILHERDVRMGALSDLDTKD